MKKLALLLIFTLGITTSIHAQERNCSIDYEEVNDTINYRKTNNVLVYEFDRVSTTSSLFFSLVNNNGHPFLNLQYLQKSPDFIPITCVAKKSMVSIKLVNGTTITAHYLGDDVCGTYTYDQEKKNNIRILDADFYIKKEHLALLKASPISMVQIRFPGTSELFIIRNELKSTIVDLQTKPTQFFIDNIPCIE
ncbi:hypothetical protein HX045_11820 [Myroides odoratimimus]|uniref:Uncharacterized protein n=3 Tax=Myroides odoratimimus TaxID=76832 RepID=A0A0S7EE54_9FLAO|nr:MULTISPECIES: hypothetical protein [Myroides]ALU26940.1 hypothetical protein AS202_12615 [Myroides odoratimimus]APA92955.1 hypothetical protein BK054_12165 [Myroides sp. ZB35]EHO08723.1 hypothetical protein HMPREF9712_02385 [Myroides odoratimimus CCUG 10230]EHO10516.1 hypothetical protein HMPREF9714_01480 [Myroides odoratimimus CCUG 12901]EHO12371.1 hypothetical protein HMPREF9715_01526 [Myroides odoratimimus CIP 101113]